MTEDLLQDLVLYKKSNEKSVSSAARSLISLFRQVCSSPHCSVISLYINVCARPSAYLHNHAHTPYFLIICVLF